MQARQNYRTMARMQRRRSYVQSKVGTKEDFSSREEPDCGHSGDRPGRTEYVGELERLAQLREQGILSDEEFEAKKKQILGI